jgi:site-specific recombinase
LLLTIRTPHTPFELMKKDLAGVIKRLVAGMLVTTAIVGVSAFTIHTPSQNSAARSLKSIQTDKATLFYAGFHPDANIFVEQVLPGTGENKAATENLRLVAAAL